MLWPNWIYAGASRFLLGPFFLGSSEPAKKRSAPIGRDQVCSPARFNVGGTGVWGSGVNRKVETSGFCLAGRLIFSLVTKRLRPRQLISRCYCSSSSSHDRSGPPELRSSAVASFCDVHSRFPQPIDIQTFTARQLCAKGNWFVYKVSRHPFNFTIRLPSNPQHSQPASTVCKEKKTHGSCKQFSWKI